MVFSIVKYLKIILLHYRLYIGHDDFYSFTLIIILILLGIIDNKMSILSSWYTLHSKYYINVCK